MEKIGQYVALAQHSATAQHFLLPLRLVPSFQWYNVFPSVAELLVLTVKLFDSAPVREDDPAYATQLARNRRSTHPKRRHIRHTPIADRECRLQLTSLCVLIPHHRHKLYSVLRHHWVACAPKREVGSPCACGDVCACGVLW